MSATPSPPYGGYRHPKDLPQEIDPVAVYVAALSRHPAVRTLILFGSRAIGDNYPRSDVDMAVVLDTEDRWAWHEVVEAAEDARTLIPIDLVRYEDTTRPFRDEIDQHGKVVYERAQG